MCVLSDVCVFFFKQKTAYEMRISDWSSDVCSSDLRIAARQPQAERAHGDEHQSGTEILAASDPEETGTAVAWRPSHDRHHLSLTLWESRAVGRFQAGRTPEIGRAHV